MQVVAWRACTPSSSNPPINSPGSKSRMSPRAAERCWSRSARPASTGPTCCRPPGCIRRHRAPANCSAWRSPASSRRSATTSRNGQPGQEVCALLAGGGYAEYVAVPAGQLLPHPVGLDLQDSAGVPEVACTVWSNLVMTAHLSEGQLLLMHGGASGVGSHAIQVARALGARVAVTAGSAAKLESCRELGAEILINYRDEDFVERGAGSDRRRGRRRDLRHHGRLVPGPQYRRACHRRPLVIIGMQGGIKGELNIGKLLSKRAHVIGTTLRGRPATGPEQQERSRRGGGGVGLADDR